MHALDEILICSFVRLCYNFWTVASQRRACSPYRWNPAEDALCAGLPERYPPELYDQQRDDLYRHICAAG